MKYIPILIFLGILSLTACKTIPIEDCTEVDENFVTNKIFKAYAFQVKAMTGRNKLSFKCGHKIGDVICSGGDEVSKMLYKVQERDGKFYWCGKTDIPPLEANQGVMGRNGISVCVKTGEIARGVCK